MPVPRLRTAPVTRRVPSQQRSRALVKRVLTVATALIAEHGSDALRMSDVADAAGCSIGSLYQYFPDKTSIIGALADRYNAEGRACVLAELESVRNSAQLRSALCRVVDGYYAMFLGEPAMRAIWAATQADKTLMAIDAADAQAHASMLYDVLRKLRPQHDQDELLTQALLLTQLMASAVRLAISVDRRRGDAIIQAFKRMIPADSIL